MRRAVPAAEQSEAPQSPMLIVAVARGRNVFFWLDTIVIDVRYALRHLRRHPFFSLTAILTLALGIGANTASFSLLHGIRWRVLSVTAPHDLVTIGFSRTDDDAPSPFSTSTYSIVQHLRTQSHLFVDASAWYHETTTVVDPDGTTRARHIALVSGNGFEILGLRAHHGRLLTPADDTPDGPDGEWPVVLGYTFWREQFAADPRIVGSTITVQGTTARIVGVAPRRFPGPWTGIDPVVYLPFRFAGVLRKLDFDSGVRKFLFLADSLARVRPGVTRARLEAEKDPLKDWIFTRLPTAEVRERFFRRINVSIEPAATGLPTEFRLYDVVLFALQFLTGLALLLCCLIVSGLMHSRLDHRRHELTLRAIAGATRLRLAQQLLIEAFVIALAAAAVGSLVAWYGSRLLVRFFLDGWRRGQLVTWYDSTMALEPDGTVFLAAAGTAVVVTLLIGIRPAWRASRSTALARLRGPRRQLVRGTVRRLARWPVGDFVRRLSARLAKRRIVAHAFVASLLGLALVLIVIATLMVRSLLLFRTQDFGFDPGRVAYQSAPYTLLAEKGHAKLDAYQRLIDRLTHAPGVTAAAFTSEVPMLGRSSGEWSGPIGDNPATGDTTTLAEATVGSGYFRTMGMTLIAGREFTPDERTPHVCILNQRAASFLFPNHAAVGRDLATSDKRFADHRISSTTTGAAYTCRVVGVVNDARDVSLHDPLSTTIYYPVTPETYPGAEYNLVLLINATSKATAIAAFRDAQRQVAPALPITPFTTLREQVDTTMESEQAMTWLATFGGAVSLPLAAIGLHSLLSSRVTRRTREIGIRVTMGGSRRAITRLVIVDALRLVAIGLLLGDIALAVLAQSIQPLLYRISIVDAPTWLVTMALFALAVSAASVWPIRRALAISELDGHADRRPPEVDGGQR